MNAKEVLSSPSLKFARPSLIQSFCKLWAGFARELPVGGAALFSEEINVAGSHLSKFQRPSEFRARIKLGRSSCKVPSSKRPRKKPVQRKPADKRSARRRYS